MIELALIVAAIAFASFVSLVAIPELGRRAAVYQAHAAREIFYATFASARGAKSTHVYRDIEFLFSSFIMSLRERPAFDALMMFMVTSPARPKRAPSSENNDLYDREVRNLFPDAKEREAAGEKIGHAMRTAREAALWRVTLANPICWIVLPFTLLRHISLPARPKAVRIVDAAAKSQTVREEQGKGFPLRGVRLGIVAWS